MKILIYCTEGNSCRSQMAEAFLSEMDQSIQVYSASLYPDQSVDQMAVLVMKEFGIDMSKKSPKSYRNFEGVNFDFLITLCSGSKDKSEVIEIPARHKIHLGFEDPRKTSCTNEKLIYLYRDVRDSIKEELEYFYSSILLPELHEAD